MTMTDELPPLEPPVLRPLSEVMPGMRDEEEARAAHHRAEEEAAEVLAAMVLQQEREADAKAEAERLLRRSMGKALFESLQGRDGVARFTDLRPVLEGGVVRPKPTLLRRRDGVGLAYPGRDTVLVGDPEVGKSLVCAFAAAQVLREGGTVAWVDTDYNGDAATAARLVDFGIAPEVVWDQTRFRYADPDDAPTMTATVAALAEWAPTLVVIDSIGEVIPLYGGSYLDADDYRRVHRAVVKPLSRAGAATLVLDHLPKGADAKAYGSAGTYAKKSVVDGVMLRVSQLEALVPGKGGASTLTVLKDRHGGLRQHCPKGGEPQAAVFRIQPGSPIEAELWAPNLQLAAPAVKTDAEMVAELPPEKRTVRGAREHLKFGGDRASLAVKAYRDAQYLDGG